MGTAARRVKRWPLELKPVPPGLRTIGEAVDELLDQLGLTSPHAASEPQIRRQTVEYPWQGDPCSTVANGLNYSLAAAVLDSAGQ